MRPDHLFGDLLFPFTSLVVAVVLFEGGLTLKFQEIRGIEKVIRNLISVGTAITWLITAAAERWLLCFFREIELLFGAIMVVTGPTVIVPMLRTVRPKEHVAHILRWEEILIDPIGPTLAALVYRFIVSGAEQAEVLASLPHRLCQNPGHRFRSGRQRRLPTRERPAPALDYPIPAQFHGTGLGVRCLRPAQYAGS